MTSRKLVIKFMFFLAPSVFMIACQTASLPPSGPMFTQDSLQTTDSAMTVEQQVQQRELEGYVARTSSRRFMRLPKELNLTLSGALKYGKKVEFTDPPPEDYTSHLSPFKMTDYSREISFRPLFNDRRIYQNSWKGDI